MRFHLLSALVCAAPFACTSGPDVGTVVGGLRSANGLDQQALLDGRPALIALASDQITGDGFVSSGMLDTDSGRSLAPYVARCALPAGTTVSATDGDDVYTFTGEEGLGGSWLSGACDATCRGWMSACLMAHVNALDTPVPMSMRGPSSALATTASERSQYPFADAAFYGDLFGDQPQLYACTAPGITSSLLHARLCGLGLTCSFTITGVCHLPLGLGACAQANQTVDGYFGHCRPLLGGILGGTAYDQVVTTYLSSQGLQILYGLTNLLGNLL